MKKIKSNVLWFLVGAVLFSGIAYVAATSIASNTVEYSTVKNANVETVEDALDDLYDQIIGHPITCYNGTCGKLTYKYWNDGFSRTTYQKNAMPATVYASRAALETAYGASNFADSPVYIRSVLIDGNVVGHESCFWEANNQKEFCIGPNYWAGTIGTNDATVGENTKIKLQRDMQNALSLESTDISCSSNTNSARCNVGVFYCSAITNGDVYCYSNVTNKYCYVSAGGSALCRY